MDTKKIANNLPKWILPLVRKVYCYYQKYATILASRKEAASYKPNKEKKRILIYGVSALSFGGTEKNLQIITKHLDKEEYDVYLMYGTKSRKLGNYNAKMIAERLEYVKQGGNITLIPFDYESLGETHPYIAKNMFPHITNTIKYYDIDLVILAGAGNAEYPLTEIKNCPIIFLNIFGIPNVLKNITYQLCISRLVKDMISDVVPEKKLKVFYIPSEGPFSTSMQDGIDLRKKLGFSDTDIIFGRIGRADDSIFDPIGILAFEKVVKKYSNIHYLIVSPAQKLIKLVKEHNIPNVHFMYPIYAERDVWAFHNAIDVLAHFRFDGETCGLNIAESMLCSKPIISHKSNIRNAHLEYLNSKNSFIAYINNVEQYADAIEIFAKDKNKKLIHAMGEEARNTAMEHFHIDNYMKRFNHLIKDVLGK